MPNEEKANQLGRLMLDKKASEASLAELRLKAKNIGARFETIARVLNQNPALLVFPRESIDTRFEGALHLTDGTVASADEVKALTNAIREEQLKLWGYAQEMKNLGF